MTPRLTHQITAGVGRPALTLEHAMIPRHERAVPVERVEALQCGRRWRATPGEFVRRQAVVNGGKRGLGMGLSPRLSHKRRSRELLPRRRASQRHGTACGSFLLLYFDR